MENAREQFIERLTRELFLKRGSGFVLKGRGAMRTLFGNQRLTKDVDLDFTNPKRSAESLHNIVRRAIAAAARGLPIHNLRISEPGKSGLSPRWKVNFTDQEDRTRHVEIEVSRDPRRAAPGSVTQRPYQPQTAKGIARFWVDIYDEPTLTATKIAALLGREAPRDVYDLDLLKSTSDPPGSEIIAWAIKRTDTTGRRPAEIAWTHLDALSWERFQTELADALPPEVAERIDEAEWVAMKLRVGEYVEGLLGTYEAVANSS
jgi:predicted nucleotidyltransferase component of viral defense system